MCRAEGNKGEKKLDNCNSIISKIYLKTTQRLYVLHEKWLMARVNASGIHKMKLSLWSGVIYEDFLWEEFELELKDSQNFTKERKKAKRWDGVACLRTVMGISQRWVEGGGEHFERLPPACGGPWPEEWVVRLYTTAKWMLNSLKLNYVSNFIHVNIIEWALQLNFLSDIFKMSTLVDVKWLFLLSQPKSEISTKCLNELAIIPQT